MSSLQAETRECVKCSLTNQGQKPTGLRNKLCIETKVTVNNIWITCSSVHLTCPERAAQGRVVGRLKSGRKSIFSRNAYLARSRSA